MWIFFSVALAWRAEGRHIFAMESLFIGKLFTKPFEYLAWVIIVMFSICLHEFSHARMALQMGDDTAARQGHLSLNPLRQMGMTSMIMLAVIGIAWGSVPVDPRRLAHRWGAALVSFAGPAANLLLALIFGMLTALVSVMLDSGSEPNYAMSFFFFGCMANAVLFVLNMLPVPMFDGWSVFSIFFPGLQKVSAQTAQTFSWVFILVVFATPVGDVIWTAGAAFAYLIIGAAGSLLHLFA